MLLYLLLGRGIPLVLFSIDLNNGYAILLTNIDYWDLYNKVIMVYSPFFIYGIIAEFLMPNYVIPAYQYFKSLRFKYKIHRARNLAVIICISVSITVAFTDFNGGAAAIWEMKPPY